jgi:Glycosyl transferase family 2
VETPLLSVIVPTVGRPSLQRTLRSLLRQGDWLPWEAVVVGDTHAGTWAHQLPGAYQLTQSDPRFVYTECDGGQHAWGHPQRNHGAGVARGQYLSYLGDDDIYLPHAFQSIGRALRRHEADPRVFLFRWIAPWKQVYWEQAGFLAQDHIDAECIVCPNSPLHLGVWTNRYQGDFDFIRETVDRWGGVERVVWQPELIAQAQPTDGEDWTQGGREAAPVLVPGMVA